MKQPVIAVIGGGRENRPEYLEAAEAVGRGIAARGAVLLCGGMMGVMEAACRGASQAGGIAVGILPGDSRETANPYVTLPIVTGMGIGRNVIIARSADALIAVGGEYGTLSEIALALQMGRPVVAIGSWSIPGVQPVSTPEEALTLVFSLLGR